MHMDDIEFFHFEFQYTVKPLLADSLKKDTAPRADRSAAPDCGLITSESGRRKADM